MSINAYAPSVVLSNLTILSELKSGEKLTTSEADGVIKKEDRWIFTAPRRGYWKAFSIDIVDRTFNQAIAMLRESKISRASIDNALTGLSVLHLTYINERKDRGVDKIRKKYLEQLSSIDNAQVVEYQIDEKGPNLEEENLSLSESLEEENSSTEENLSLSESLEKEKSSIEENLSLSESLEKEGTTVEENPSVDERLEKEGTSVEENPSVNKSLEHEEKVISQKPLDISVPLPIPLHTVINIPPDFDENQKDESEEEDDPFIMAAQAIDDFINCLFSPRI